MRPVAKLQEAFRLLGDLDAELSAQERLVAEARTGPGQPTADQLNTLADIYYRLERNDEARQQYTEALKVIDETEPDNDEVAAILRHNLANILDQEGQTEACLELHEEALAGMRRSLGAR